jgi:hypothetical protein
VLPPLFDGRKALESISDKTNATKTNCFLSLEIRFMVPPEMVGLVRTLMEHCARVNYSPELPGVKKITGR